MSVTRADVVAEAREWVGTTRFEHQHSHKGNACDCIGLARGVYRELGLMPSPDKLARVAHLRGYSASPDGVSFKAFCDEMLEPLPIDSILPGHFILMKYTQDPQHSAIVADYRHGGLSMIHALPRMGVCEHRLNETWRARIVAAYAFPGVM